MVFYFAYGSNLAIPRMRDRVPGVRVFGRARLESHRLVFDKRGRDGSGKANIAPDPQANVWGALYSLEAEEWSLLDGFEPGYERVGIAVVLESGQLQGAETYRAIAREPGLLPLAEYKRFITEGALAHELPESYRAAIETVRARRK
jgi:gamma-glutamylcyclotransferase